MVVAFTSDAPTLDAADVDTMLKAALSGYDDVATSARRLVLAGLCTALPAGVPPAEVRAGLLRVGNDPVRQLLRKPRSGLFQHLVRDALTFTLSSSSPAGACAGQKKVASVARRLVGMLSAPVDSKAAGVSPRMVVAARHGLAIVGASELAHLRETGMHGVLLSRGYFGALTNRSADGAGDVIAAMVRLGWIRKVKLVGGTPRYRISARLTDIQDDAAWANSPAVNALAVGGDALLGSDAAALIDSSAASVWTYWDGHLGSRAWTRAFAGAAELTGTDLLGLSPTSARSLALELHRDLPGLGEPGVRLDVYLKEQGIATLAVDLADDRMTDLREASAARAVLLDERREDSRFINELFTAAFKLEGIGPIPHEREGQTAMKLWVGAATAHLGQSITEPGMRTIATTLLRRDLIARAHDPAVARKISQFVFSLASAAGAQNTKEQGHGQ